MTPAMLRLWLCYDYAMLIHFIFCKIVYFIDSLMVIRLQYVVTFSLLKSAMAFLDLFFRNFEVNVKAGFTLAKQAFFKSGNFKLYFCQNSFLFETM